MDKRQQLLDRISRFFVDVEFVETCWMSSFEDRARLQNIDLCDVSVAAAEIFGKEYSLDSFTPKAQIYIGALGYTSLSFHVGIITTEGRCSFKGKFVKHEKGKVNLIELGETASPGLRNFINSWLMAVHPKIIFEALVVALTRPEEREPDEDDYELTIDNIIRFLEEQKRVFKFLP